MENIVCPGSLIGHGSKFLAGKGAYFDKDNSVIRSSLLGKVVEEKGSEKTILHVITPFRKAKDFVVEVGDTILGRYPKTRTIHAHNEIK